MLGTCVVVNDAGFTCRQICQLWVQILAELFNFEPSSSKWCLLCFETCTLVVSVLWDQIKSQVWAVWNLTLMCVCVTVCSLHMSDGDEDHNFSLVCWANALSRKVATEASLASPGPESVPCRAHMDGTGGGGAGNTSWQLRRASCTSAVLCFSGTPTKGLLCH